MCYTDCFNTPEKIREELSTQEILRIMDEIADAGCLELTLTGGEPLTRPDFFEIYSHAKKKGFLVTLFTNATLITEKIADRLAANPPARVEISFHGATESAFESITQGRGSYARCRDAIRMLIERRIALVLKSTLMTVNKSEVLEIKKYAESLGQALYHVGEEIRPALDGSEGPFKYQLNNDELKNFERQDKAIWNEACCKNEESCGVCQNDRQSFHIDAYGRLQRCTSNRLAGYDLRKGSFVDGFYGFLQDFPCPAKNRHDVADGVCGVI
ncbi:MAG: hypothetical protein AUJ72_00860 [Candidatus Omnitrophica bacterium CG1_02_46_14]|nr:MAG: hypothetical protein AUJ72_00860 [Candidatus Omnitrophica bacterium CG1_02_46_14]